MIRLRRYTVDFAIPHTLSLKQISLPSLILDNSIELEAQELKTIIDLRIHQSCKLDLITVTREEDKNDT